VNATEGDAHQERPGARRRPRSALVWGTCAAAAVALTVLAAWQLTPHSVASDETEPAPSTVAIEKRDLTQTLEVQGTLGYADKREVVAGVAGTLTSTVAPGTVVKAGETLYTVDERPVVLFDGTTPAWRELGLGVSNGVDIKQLESNLVRLGYANSSNLTVDQEWTWRTTAAVQRWQEAKGLEQTGRIEYGRVVFLPGERRVADTSIPVGRGVAPGTAVQSTTSQERTVDVPLDARRQGSVSAGMTAEVTLPDGSRVDATVSSIGTVARSAGGDETTATIDVELTLDDPEAVMSLDGAAVAVAVPLTSVEQVLAVPVTALVATASEGYAVEVFKNDKRTVVPVEVGMFASGWVQISSDELSAGVNVVVPS
jgi:peptidoglycan hydrolase-like protein with peptidoglycan-binding domain